MGRLFFSAMLFFASPLFGQSELGRLRLACVGASITQGALLKDPATGSYPAQLQQRLGVSYEVHNYGVGGCTMLRKGDHSYWKTAEYQAALASKPDIVTIDLGGNDSKLINRLHLDEYSADCRDMIQSFASLPSRPRIILMLPVVSFVRDTTGIWDPVIASRIIPLLKEAAYTSGVEIFNAHALLIDKPAMFPDGIHPDTQGAGIIADNLYAVLTARRDPNYVLFDKIPFSKTYSSFHGYQCADFEMAGRNCKIARPKLAAASHPWVWRARFWGHEPQTDIALLERGYHIVYCDVAELLGNPQAIAHWNKFYQLLQSGGLAKKAVMEGMSRGAVYIFNWAAANPGKVACVYADNPLLNIHVWTEAMLQLPAGTTNDMFEAFKIDYGLQTPKQVRAFKGGPMESVKQIVKGHYPILVICADQDEAVPLADNAVLFEKKIRDLHGSITVIHKPGFKHHPHSLPDPTPIVDFIVCASK